MQDPRATHLFTESGSLCGTTEVDDWTLVESRVSCLTCRAILELRALKQRQAERRVVVTLATIRDGP